MKKKLHSSAFFKRVLSFALAFAMLLSLMPPIPHAHAAEDGTAVYLKPNANWLQGDARFAVYCWNDSGNNWLDLSDTDGDGYYEGTVPAGYSNVIFCRMNPGAAENNWDNKWNQTADLTLPTDGTNCYTVADGTWDAGGGEWSVFAPEEEEPEETEKPEAPAATYYVAGVAELCGSGWDCADTANQMTLNADGKYEKTYSEVAAGTYEFKVTDGTWDNSWGSNGGNYAITLETVSNVTILFDAETKEITVSVEAVEAEPEETETPVDPDAVYYVAGDSALCGTNWDCADAANQMTLNGSVYEKVYTNVAAGTYNLKVTDGTWNNSWGDNGQNYTFVVSAACDVTVTFDPSTNKVSVTGDNVGRENGLEITQMSAVGDGSGNWLNGKNWDVAANAMTEVSDNVYEITFKNVASGSYQFKFAANCAWTHSWGGGGAEGEAVYNGQNIALKISYEQADVTLQLDMTGYDHATKTGATYSVTVTEVAAEPTVDYYLIGYINGADYGCNDDYANLGEYKFVDGKLTATFTADSYVFVKTGDNANWYMAEAYAAEPPVVLKNTTAGTSEKLFVPGNVELEFTLVDNGDDTLTLSYAEVKAEPEIPEGYTAVRLHFFKTEGWGSTINAYIWTDSGALAGYEDYNAWPGKAISENADHAGWYDLVVATETPTAFNFIFNDGGNQTGDLYTGNVTGDTELWIVGNTVSATAPGEWSGDYDYTANIHFLKPAGWGEIINAWIWDANGALPGYEQYQTAWPGAPIEADAINSGWYNVSVTKDTEEGFSFILNDGNGNQTADLSTGTLDVTTNLWVVDGVVLTEAPEGWVDPSRTVHVPGTFPGPSWDASSNQMTYDPDLALYVYTFEAVPAANYEFKIAINGSWGENYGAGGVKDGANMAVTVPETMDVTVYYNDNTHYAVTSVDYKFLDITLSGTGIPEGTKLTDEALSGIYSAVVSMAAGTYSDITISFDDSEYAFGEFELTEAKDVTFFFEPVSGLYYHDGSDVKVGEDAIFYDSQDASYKSPFGAVAAGEEVTFTITTGEDVIQAKLIIKGVGTFDMALPEVAAYELGTKNWSCTASVSNPGEYDYYFVLSNGSDVKVYGDDDGYYGTGKVTDLTGVMPYDLVVYEAGFETPDWMKDAVIYQIFPDRFFDGDESNNQAQTWARGEVDYEYIPNWYTLPENPEQESMLDEATYKSSGAHYGDGQWSNEIYGGDLEGITQRIDYLKALGVNVIYLNPIFWSISNHRYDAVDYMEIDPILGTLGDFEELVAIAEANGMHIILDGVFNHVSDDSVYFDRYYKFLGTSEKIGAYPYWAYVYDYMAEKGAAQADAEAAAKAYFTEEYGITDYSYTEWFAVRSTTMAGSVDNIGLRAGKEVYSYEGWWGYDSMPVIYSTNGSEYQTGNWADEIINGSDSVTQYWITKGNNGWRLDVANEVSDETWQRFRDSVKSLDSDAVIIGEIWDDATKYLMGDMYDSVMNYQFRNAVTSFAMGTGAEATTKAMEKIRERYPEEAFYAMMNLVGSHDTTRILSYLDGIGDDRNQKDFDSAFPTYAGTSATAKARQHLVAFLQFTYAGAPTIYYGDEIGMVGSDDPDDRRAFEWGKGNQELVEWYATLAAIREAYPALRTGDVQPMETGSKNLLGYSRNLADRGIVVVANNSASAIEFIPEEAYGVELVDLISGKTYAADAASYTVPGYCGIILVPSFQTAEVELNLSGLKPAYDPSYIVAERSAEAPDHTHSYEAVVTAPTCTEGGYTTHTCSVCGDTYTDSETAALGHKGSWQLVDLPTDTEKGAEKRNCLVCGEEETREIGWSEIDAPKVTASNVASSGKIELTWKKIDGAVKYYVYRATSKNGTYTRIKVATGTTMTNTSAEAGSKYYYCVYAVDENGNVSKSAVVSRICDLAQPKVTVGNDAATGKPELSWNAVEGAVSYKVYRATSKNGSYILMKTVKNDTSMINKNAVVGKLYYYKVVAVYTDTYANSAASAIVSRTCDLARPVVSVSNVASTGKVKLTWNAVEGAVKYEVYRATSKDGTYSRIATTTSTSVTNIKAEAGNRYYYKVRAIHSNNNANSAYSVIKSRTCDLARPDVTVKLNNSGKPRLSWDAIDGAVKYEIYRSTSKTGAYKLVKTTTNTSWTNTGAKSGTTYYYKVRAISGNVEANSAYSSVDFIRSK